MSTNERTFEPESGRLPRVRPTSCPNCGGQMYHAALRTAGRTDFRVFIEDESSEVDDDCYQSLDAWVCKACGYVELHTMPSAVYCQGRQAR